MKVQTVVENLNQGSVAIAILKKLQITNSKTGVKSSIYRALDEDGILSDDYVFEDWKERGIDLMAKLTVKKVRPVVKQTAGDYLSPFLAEKFSIGELALLFKKWLPEMVMDRWHARRFDEATQKFKEGRLLAFFKASGMIMSGHKNEIDKDRVRSAYAGLAEIVLASSLKIIHMLTVQGMCDTPECREKRGPALYALNIMGRLTDDVIMFIHPGRMWNNISNPFAVQGAFNNLRDFGNDIFSYILPFGETGKYKTTTEDHEAGDLKFIPKLEKLIPFYRTNVVNVRDLSRSIRTEASIRENIKNKKTE